MALNTNARTNCNQCLLDASHNRLCIYRTKLSYIRELLYFLVNFLMDVTHCNIGLPMGKFWILPIITSAMESVKGIGNQNQNSFYYSPEKNILNKKYVSWGSKHSLFLDFFCKTKKMICIKIYVLGGPCGKCIFQNFTDKTKLMILFNLRRLGAEKQSFSFLNYWKIKWKKNILKHFLQIVHFYTIFFLLKIDGKCKN